MVITHLVHKEMVVIFERGKNPCLSITDGYKAKTAEDINAALDVIHASDGYKVLQAAGYTRTRESQFREWKAHNLLYRLGIMRERTGCVHIDQNEPKWRRAVYAFLSIF